MILRARLISRKASAPLAATLGLVIFAAGVTTGAVIRPVTPALTAPDPEPAMSGAAPRAVAPGSHPAEVLRVIDGDTFEARVHIWPGMQVTTRVRLRGIDAPELKGRCSEEHAKAERARRALSAILAEGDVLVRRVTFDKYGGRVVADASTQGTPDVSQALLAGGFARGYDGGRRQSWCG
jgi:endonuclease YncB( thermonuclease family)